MNKELTIVKKDTKLLLAKTKKQIDFAKEILQKKNEILDDDWIKKLWKWADENYIPKMKWIDSKNEYTGINGYWRGLPRNKENILNFVSTNNNENRLQEVCIEEIQTGKFNIINDIECRYGKNYRTFTSKNFIFLNYFIHGIVVLINIKSNKIIYYKIFEFENNKDFEINGEYITIDTLIISNCEKYIAMVEQYDLDPDTAVTIHIFDTNNGNKINEFGYSYDLYGLLFSSDSQYIVSSSENCMELRSINNNEPIQQYLTEYEAIAPLYIDTKKGFIVSDSPYHIRQIWDIESGKDISNKINLHVLNLANNNIKTLPKEIANLTNLTELNLNTNNLTKLPDEIINLIKLESIDLRNNPNLILTKKQKEWVSEIEKKACDVFYGEDLIEQALVIPEIDEDEIPF